MPHTPIKLEPPSDIWPPRYQNADVVRAGSLARNSFVMYAEAFTAEEKSIAIIKMEGTGAPIEAFGTMHHELGMRWPEWRRLDIKIVCKP